MSSEEQFDPSVAYNKEKESPVSTTRNQAVRAAGIGVRKAFRFTLYVLLVLVGRLLLPIANVATTMGLIIFLFCLIFRRDMVTPMWAGAGLAVSALAVTTFYEAMLRLVAPADVVIISEL